MKTQLLHKVRELLNALERTMGEPGDLPNTLQHIAQIAHTFFAADACVIFAINPITNHFMALKTVPEDFLKKEAFEQPKPEWFTWEVLERGVLAVEDLEALPEYRNQFTPLEGTRSLAALPLKDHQKLLGVLYLYFRHQQHFNTEELELFHFFADQASFILQETWLLHRYQEVARIGQDINHDLATVDILFQKLQKHMANIVDISCAFSLAIYQPQTNTLDLYMQEKGNSIHLNEVELKGACTYAIETQKTLFVQHLSKEAEDLPFQIAPVPGTEPKESLIFVPLVLRDAPLGVLSIQHDQSNAYNQDDRFILQLLANHIALAQHNIGLYKRLNQLNETGQLLTQQLESEQTLQSTVDKICEATQADVVVLYPYESAHEYFMLPPRIAGTLLDPTSYQLMAPNRPNDIASLMLHHAKPIFAKESASLYKELPKNVRIRQGNFQEREKIRSMVAVPLRVGDESVGVLFINFRQPQRFDASQKLFIESLAHYAAISIKNAQIFGTLSLRRVRELEILQNIDELDHFLDLESVLNTLLRLANEQVPAEEASILLHNPQTETLAVAATTGHHAEARQTQIFPLQETKGITRWVLEHKQPVRVDNVRRDLPWRDLYLSVGDDMVSELAVPLLDGEEAVGVLNFESSREGAFRQEDQDFLITLAGRAVLAIKKAQAYEREKRLAAEGQVLNQICKEITSQLDLIHVFDLIIEKALELTHANLCSLMLYDPDQNDLWMAAERGIAKEKKRQRQSLNQGIVGHVAVHKQLCNVQDVYHPPWNKIYLEFLPGTRSELAVPMLAGNELRGVLNVESPSPNNFSESDERLLQGLADLAVVALQNAERYEKARREAQRFELLYRVGQELGKITDLAQLEQAYDVVVQIAERHSQSQVVIYRYDETNAELVLKCASRNRQAFLFERIKLDEGLNGQVAREQRTIVIPDIDHLPPDVVPIKQSDPSMHSFVVTPIKFKDRYYGNLGLRHENVGYFRGTDIRFFEGLAQQLASTIYRLETVQARQDSEQRVKAAEEMSSIGQSVFEVTHRLGNDLGLVRSYVNDIRAELKRLDVSSMLISEKLDNIVRAARTVLNLSKGLKHVLIRSREALAGEPIVIHPRVLLEEVQNIPSLPPAIQIGLEIDEDVATVRVVYRLVADILHNLVTNAIEAMAEGGKITLSARNAGRSVALEVSDTGPGIPQQNLPKVFDLFFSTKGSTGFGLWSARRNALKNRGDLTVKSKVGHGTTFTLLLPRVESGTL